MAESKPAKKAPAASKPAPASAAETKSETKDEAPEKKECPITRKQFKDHAQPLSGSIAGHDIVLSAKEFGTGTLGWFGNGSFKVMIDGEEVKVPFQIQAFIPNSKTAK